MLRVEEVCRLPSCGSRIAFSPCHSHLMGGELSRRHTPTLAHTHCWSCVEDSLTVHLQHPYTLPSHVLDEGSDVLCCVDEDAHPVAPVFFQRSPVTQAHTTHAPACEASTSASPPLSSPSSGTAKKLSLPAISHLHVGSSVRSKSLPGNEDPFTPSAAGIDLSSPGGAGAFDALPQSSVPTMASSLTPATSTTTTTTAPHPAMSILSVPMTLVEGVASPMPIRPPSHGFSHSRIPPVDVSSVSASPAVRKVWEMAFHGEFGQGNGGLLVDVDVDVEKHCDRVEHQHRRVSTDQYQVQTSPQSFRDFNRNRGMQGGGEDGNSRASSPLSPYGEQYHGPAGAFSQSSSQAQHHSLPSVEVGASPCHILEGGHTRHHIKCMCWSECGARIATGGSDKVVAVWEVMKDSLSGIQQQHPVALLEGHEGSVFTVEFRRQSCELLASGSFDNTVRLWDVELRKNLLAMADENGAPVEDLSWHPVHLHVLASGSRDRVCRLWDTRSKECIARLSSHADRVLSVSWEPLNGHILATACRDKKIRLWDVRFLSSQSSITSSSSMSSLSNALGHTVVSSTVSVTSTPSSVSLSEQPTLLATLTGHTSAVQDLCWNAPASDADMDHYVLASCDAHGSVKLWEMNGASAECIACWTDNRHASHGFDQLSWSSDGLFLAAAGSGTCGGVVWATKDRTPWLKQLISDAFIDEFQAQVHAGDVRRLQSVCDLLDTALSVHTAKSAAHHHPDGYISVLDVQNEASESISLPQIVADALAACSNSQQCSHANVLLRLLDAYESQLLDVMAFRRLFHSVDWTHSGYRKALLAVVRSEYLACTILSSLTEEMALRNCHVDDFAIIRAAARSGILVSLAALGIHPLSPLMTSEKTQLKRELEKICDATTISTIEVTIMHRAPLFQLLRLSGVQCMLQVLRARWRQMMTLGSGSEDLISQLRQGTALPNGGTLLHAICVTKSPGVVDLDALRTCCRIAPALACEIDSNKQTPLHLCVSHGWKQGAMVLLECDKKVAQCVDEMGRSAVHLAAMAASSDTLQVLLDSDSDACSLANHGDKEGNTPLHLLAASLAAAERIRQCAALLVHKGADVHARNKLDWTPACLCAQPGVGAIFQSC